MTPKQATDIHVQVTKVVHGHGKPKRNVTAAFITRTLTKVPSSLKWAQSFSMSARHTLLPVRIMTE